ncbi:MAG TPA: hypothetical protein VJY62_01340 [Bacteroidia bacterium]|nr:hypothetical protein [Bacteroidia bacterium]
MKKYLLTTPLFFTLFAAMFFSIYTNLSFAQSASPKKYKWGLSVAINDAHSQIAFLGGTALAMDAEGNMVSGGEKTNKSYSLSIIPKYFINDEWLIRFEYGITQINLTNFNTVTSSGLYASIHYPLLHDTIKQKINRFVAGAQFNFFKNKIIESYGGVNIPYIKYSAITRHTYTDQRNVATDTLMYSYIENKNIPGGYAAGLGVFAGFNVHVFKHVSLGAEFSSALLHYKVGGASIYESSVQIAPGPFQTTRYEYNESYKATRFTKILASFNLTFWL